MLPAHFRFMELLTLTLWVVALNLTISAMVNPFLWIILNLAFLGLVKLWQIATRAAARSQ